MYGIYLKLTNCCNLRCKHCFQRNWEGDITEEVVIELIRQFPVTKYSNIILFGGEPTLYPPDKARKLLDILVREGGWKNIAVQTNLVELNPAWIEIFKTYTGGHIGTSMDASRLHIMDVVYSHIRELQKKGIDVSVVITVTQRLTPEIFREIVDEFIKAGGYMFRIQPVNPMGNEPPITVEHYKEILDISLNYHRKFGNFENYFLLKGYISRGLRGHFFGGNCGKTVRTVDPNGDVYVCPDLSGDKRYCVGNLLDGTYEENKTKVLTLEGYRIFYERELYISRTVCNKECFTFCGGGCTVASLTVCKTHLSKDPYCEVHKYFLEVIRNGT